MKLTDRTILNALDCGKQIKRKFWDTYKDIVTTVVEKDNESDNLVIIEDKIVRVLPLSVELLKRDDWVIVE